ncbi:MAG: hypothetical protein CM15mP84_05760 [Cellvibrionales bacterium]|nr:MAG: hypothetical protein CM15mP84_05760 [Cellvibrionales bacterium]
MSKQTCLKLGIPPPYYLTLDVRPRLGSERAVNLD